MQNYLSGRTRKPEQVVEEGLSDGGGLLVGAGQLLRSGVPSLRRIGMKRSLFNR